MAKNPKNNIGACLKIKKKLQKKNSFACWNTKNIAWVLQY